MNRKLDYFKNTQDNCLNIYCYFCKKEFEVPNIGIDLCSPDNIFCSDECMEKSRQSEKTCCRCDREMQDKDYDGEQEHPTCVGCVEVTHHRMLMQANNSRMDEMQQEIEKLTAKITDLQETNTFLRDRINNNQCICFCHSGLIKDKGCCPCTATERANKEWPREVIVNGLVFKTKNIFETGFQGGTSITIALERHTI